jgi:hypothetical protein
MSHFSNSCFRFYASAAFNLCPPTHGIYLFLQHQEIYVAGEGHSKEFFTFQITTEVSHFIILVTPVYVSRAYNFVGTCGLVNCRPK